MKNLNKIVQRLKTILNTQKISQCIFPTLWKCNNIKAEEKFFVMQPEEFFLSQIEWILKNQIVNKEQTKKEAIIYNLFPRFTTAFDHNQDGKIINSSMSFKETGTLLKSIALLPYLKNIGVDIVHLLPITSIGKEGQKGDLGSPYSISNPYKLDEFLNEPLLELPIEDIFSAFVEAAHLLGMKVVTEFVFRTASKDSELAIKHPEWFYWIKDDIVESDSLDSSEEYYGSPKFSDEELWQIKHKVENGDLGNLPVPHQIYRDMFTDVPLKVEKNEQGKIVGRTKDGQKVKIPGAFADWPPNDIQPAWSDITYLKMYENKDYNYIAYNTVRMYDTELAQEKYELKSLWEHIENIIPYYQDKFSIDGVMVDMGHSLPKKLMSKIITSAREKKSDFIFWEENFVPNADSVKEGYNLVLGYLPFDAHNCHKMRELVYKLENKEFPIDFFATSETHNTPRSASRVSGYANEFNKLMYAVNAFLPLPLFLHSGFELCETFPVNIGLGFEQIDTSSFHSDKLPLFSTANLDWGASEIVDFIRHINQIRNKYFSDDMLQEIKLIHSDYEDILMFRRNTSADSELIIVANYAGYERRIDFHLFEIFDILEDSYMAEINEIRLMPFSVKIFQSKKH